MVKSVFYMMFGIWLNDEDAEVLKGWRDHAVWLGSEARFDLLKTRTKNMVQGSLYFHVLYIDFSSILLCAKFNVCASIQRFRCKRTSDARPFWLGFLRVWTSPQTKVKLIEKHGLESIIVDMNEKLPPKYRRSVNKDEQSRLISSESYS